MKRVALVLVVILIVSMFLTGCVLTDKLSSLKQSFKKAETPPDATTPTVIIEPQGSAPAVAGAVKTIVLYFADSTGSKLVAEERQIPKVEGIGRASIEELIKGPALAELRPTLPATTKLLDINIRTDGLGIVDFSGDLIKDLPASAAAEKLAIYSVVNTLTQFPTVEKVEIRVDGRKVDTLLGHEKIDENLVRNTSLIN